MDLSVRARGPPEQPDELSATSRTSNRALRLSSASSSGPTILDPYGHVVFQATCAGVHTVIVDGLG